MTIDMREEDVLNNHDLNDHDSELGKRNVRNNYNHDLNDHDFEYGKKNVLNNYNFENCDEDILDDHTKGIGVGARRLTESRRPSTSNGSEDFLHR